MVSRFRHRHDGLVHLFTEYTPSPGDHQYGLWCGGWDHDDGNTDMTDEPPTCLRCLDYQRMYGPTLGYEGPEYTRRTGRMR